MSGLPHHKLFIIDINNEVIAKSDDVDIIMNNDDDNNNNVNTNNDDNIHMTDNVYEPYVGDEDDDDEEYEEEYDEMYDDDDFIDDSEDEDYYEPSLKRSSYGYRRYTSGDSTKSLTPQERKLREEQQAIKREKARERRTQKAIEEAQLKEKKRKLRRDLRAQGLDAKGQPLPAKIESDDINETKVRIRRLYHEEFCFSCGCAGITVKCDACPKVYHTDCLNESGIQYVLGAEGKWICPWHSCTNCKKLPVKAETSGLIWDELFQSETFACTNCTSSYCDTCLPPNTKSSKIPKSSDLSILRRRGYIHEPKFFICTTCEPKIDDDLDKMFGSVLGNNISHLPPEDTDSEVEEKPKEKRPRRSYEKPVDSDEFLASKKEIGKA